MTRRSRLWPLNQTPREKQATMELDNHWSNWWADPGLGLSIGATAVLALSLVLAYKQSLCIGLWLIAEVRTILDMIR